MEEGSNNKKSDIYNAAATLCAVALIGVVLSFFWIWGGVSNGNTAAVTGEVRAGFPNVHLEAEAAVVLDIVSGETLFSKNEEIGLPLASLAKIATAVVANEELEESVAVSIPEQAVEEAGDTGLLVGERWSVSDLIGFTLVSSSNDGATALAAAVESAALNKQKKDTTSFYEGTFNKKMNALVDKIGLHQTFFINESGLDVGSNINGAYGSALDVARLFAYALQNYPRTIGETRYAKRTYISLDGITHNIENTNKRVEEIPGIVASKTGFTELAGGNLAIIFEAGPARPIVVVVLGSSLEGRFKDAEALVWETLRYLQS